MPLDSQLNEQSSLQEQSLIPEEQEVDKEDTGLIEELPTPESFSVLRQDENIGQYGFYVTRIISGEYFDATPTTKYIAARTLSYQVPFFIAIHPCELMSISEVHNIAGTDGSAVTLEVEKLTGTQASGGGTSILKVAFDLKNTANTVVNKVGLDFVSNTTKFDTGDRISFQQSGTLTAITDVTVTAYFKYIGKGDFLVPQF